MKAMNIEQLFFELIRVAVGTRSALSLSPTEEDWKLLYDLAKKQSLVGVTFRAVQRLNACDDSPCGNLPEELFLQWTALATRIQSRNETMMGQSLFMQRKMLESGLRSSILKGQGVALLYGELASMRQPGDIDVYVDCGLRRVLDFMRSIGLTDIKLVYKHIDLQVFSDTEVELHYIPEILFAPWHNMRFQRWVRSEATQKLIFDNSQAEIVTPAVGFNVIYILLHAFRHLLSGGVGLRQMMDYYFVLQALHRDAAMSHVEITALLHRFGLYRFARAVMWVLGEVFEGDGSRQYDWMLCPPDEHEGHFLMEEIMAGGNFGHHDHRYTRGGATRWGFLRTLWSRNLHLLSHYPAETLFTPLYYVWHFVWARMKRLEQRCQRN